VDGGRFLKLPWHFLRQAMEISCFAVACLFDYNFV
jgi:hypothetical protein